MHDDCEDSWTVPEGVHDKTLQELATLQARAKRVVESRKFPPEISGIPRNMVLVDRSSLLELFDLLYQDGLVDYGFVRVRNMLKVD